MTQTSGQEACTPSHSDVRGHVWLALLLTLAFVGVVFFTQSLRSGLPDHGDIWADVTHIQGARHLNEYGFVQLRFAQTADDGPAFGLPPVDLSHHPSFPTVLLALLYRLGLATREARIAPLLVASSALVAVYLLAGRLFRDWRLGILSLVALAASAPFRLLSDAFCYPSYDMAAEAWALLFVTLGSLAAGRRRWTWLTVGGVTAFLTISLSGFEMVPSIAAYSILFPLLFASDGRHGRLRLALGSGLLVGGGFVLGMVFRLAHNAWMLGGLQPALDDLSHSFLFRTSTDYGEYWGQPYVVALLYRLGAYYPLHLIALAGAILLRRVHGIVAPGRAKAPALSLKWVGLLFLCGILWFLGFREHSHRHAHTIYHLSLGLSLIVAVYCRATWDVLRPWRWARGLAAVAAGGLLVASLANVGVRAYGNLLTVADWSPRQGLVDPLARRLPQDALVLVDQAFDDLGTEFLLQRAFLRRPDLAVPPDTHGRPVFLITYPSASRPAFGTALAEHRLLALNEDLALFDLGAPPGLLNAIASGPVRERLFSRGTNSLGFLLHASGSGGSPDTTAQIPLPAGEAATLALRVTWQGDDPGKMAEARLSFSLVAPDGVRSLLQTPMLEPVPAQEFPAGVPLEVTIPARDAPAFLRIDAASADPGGAGDWVWLEPLSAEPG